ncbi:fungal pheromone mating factor STE2 GPCR-domain-containing protein [Podospora fimiseda]|uniref:Fungal pheromone mating factor STE2 GPCR-domain-containing protein n=1 Tax=Podospora fimiseda TaxID=252190 RepID=A0AAN7BGR2_9PEZI|nr:fungal pheromone mating factor STE2 GPCR-domain-containing protein [Podospora fimiseda]
MTSNNTQPPTTGGGPNNSSTPFDPLNQVFYILGPDGQTQIPLTSSLVSSFYSVVASLSILYGTQIGACFIMLIVVLAMTPSARFKRLPTIISILSLTLNMIRMVLLSVFYPSTWTSFYTLFAMDYQFVPRSDYNTSVTATVVSIPVTMLIMAALFVQAWSMVQLWKAMYKWPVTAFSLGLVFTTIGFNFAGVVIQARSILYADLSMQILWVRQAYLILITVSICWFCFLFNIRLVMHMWSNRTILPSLKGLNAMDVLVITNGILMFVPVVFAGLEFARWDNYFESASLTQTSAIIVLPLGTLVAQRLAAPQWFNSSISPSTGRTGGSFNPTGSTNHTGRPLLMSQNTNNTYNYGGMQQPVGITSHVVAEPYRRGSAGSEKGGRVHHSEGGYGGNSGGAGVRIERRVERHEESLTGSGSGSRSRRGSLSPTTGNMEC